MDKLDQFSLKTFQSAESSFTHLKFANSESNEFQDTASSSNFSEFEVEIKEFQKCDSKYKISYFVFKIGNQNTTG